tara:strand:- start:2858 stop:3247 length:390 start_codon:yes stop_codon:yes gene_type:complete
MFNKIKYDSLEGYNKTAKEIAEQLLEGRTTAATLEKWRKSGYPITGGKAFFDKCAMKIGGKVFYNEGEVMRFITKINELEVQKKWAFSEEVKRIKQEESSSNFRIGSTSFISVKSDSAKALELLTRGKH